MRTDATPPTPAPSAQVPDSQILAALMAQSSGVGGGADSPIVPLWMARPVQPMANGAYPKRYGPDGPQSDTSPISYVDEAYSRQQYSTKSAAEMAWLDMGDKERKAFADKALAAGMWNPKNPTSLGEAWARAVGMAADYNTAQGEDKTKWVSPWEVVDKMYAAYVAATGGTMQSPLDTGWKTETTKNVKQFSEADLQRTAEQVLQQELGRNPTAAEMKAYTIAVNQASAANPQIVNSQYRNTQFDAQGNPIARETQNVSSSEMFDPTLTIEQQARATQEAQNYRAQGFYDAAMKALGAVVQ